MGKLHIYKASAGSGKTYLLTEKWLSLALDFKLRADKFKEILAVTFTNKAAEEMRTRILEQLELTAQGSPKANHTEALCKQLKIPPDELARRASALHSEILHNYSLFSVSTIDSFVQRIIRSFAFEADINAGFEIELDTDRVSNDLIELLYGRVSEDEALRNFLVRFSMHKISEGNSWNFIRDIKNLSGELFKEDFQKIQFNFETIRDDIAELAVKLKNTQKRFEKTMHEISNETEKYISKYNIDYIGLGQKVKYVGNYLIHKIADKKFEPNKTVQKVWNRPPEEWHNKTAKRNTIEQVRAIHPELNRLLDNALNYYYANRDRYQSAKAVLANIHAFGITADLASLLPDYRADNNILLAGDTALILKEIIGNNDAPFIYEKTGSRYKHILIDEFQDTSGFQWENFKPLINNNLAESRFNLIVGDIKQSVYRWRGGDWKLLLNKAKQDAGADKTVELSLDTNWRSCKNIVDFNNAVFYHFADILQKKFNENLDKITNEQLVKTLRKNNLHNIITNAYADSYQKLAKKNNENAGKVTAHFHQKSDNYISEKLPETINDLLLSERYKAGDICILVRKNKQAGELLQMLLNYQKEQPGAVQYSIISGDALLLESAISVRILTGAIKYLNNPNDSVNNAALINNLTDYQASGHYNKEEIFRIASIPKLHDTILPEEFLNQVSDLKKLSLFELSEHLINIFKLNLHKEEFSYLQAFQDLISEYTQKFTSSLPDFINYWDEEGSQKAVQLSDSGDALQIMTVHKSKGLAFNVLIFPFAKEKLESYGFTANLLWAKPEDTDMFDKFERLPVKYSSALLNSFFSYEYMNEKIYQYIDVLNVFYVAFTRAKKELIIFGEISKTVRNMNTTADILHQILKNGAAQTDAEGNKLVSLQTFFNKADNTFCLHTGSQDEKAETPSRNINELYFEEYPSYLIQDRMSINFSSEDFFIESIESVAQKVNYGNLMHRIFAEIETADQAEPAVKEMLFKGYISGKEEKKLLETVKEMISRKELAPWFDGSAKVISEKPLTTKAGETKIPDRVLIKEDKAIVIDFKFGKRSEKHIKQISEYRDLIAEIYELPVDAYLYYAEENMSYKI